MYTIDVIFNEVLHSYKLLQNVPTALTLDPSHKHLYLLDSSLFISCFRLKYCRRSATVSPLVTLFLKEKCPTALVCIGGDRLAVGFSSGNIFLYDVTSADKDEHVTLCFHTAPLFMLEHISQDLLLSLSKDNTLAVWNVSLHQTPKKLWCYASNCSICERPFFWKIGSLLLQRKLGCIRHHCRVCGSSACKPHSRGRVNYTICGLGCKVRICDKCINKKVLMYLHIHP